MLPTAWCSCDNQAARCDFVVGSDYWDLHLPHLLAQARGKQHISRLRSITCYCTHRQTQQIAGNSYTSVCWDVCNLIVSIETILWNRITDFCIESNMKSVTTHDKKIDRGRESPYDPSLSLSASPPTHGLNYPVTCIPQHTIFTRTQRLTALHSVTELSGEIPLIVSLSGLQLYCFGSVLLLWVCRCWSQRPAGFRENALKLQYTLHSYDKQTCLMTNWWT